MLWIRLNKAIKIHPCILIETLTVRFFADKLSVTALYIIHNLERFNGYSQPPPPPQNGNINVQPRLPTSDQMPEIRKYKKRFNSEINCASLWGVNLLIGTNNGLLLLDRSGQVSPITPQTRDQRTKNDNPFSGPSLSSHHKSKISTDWCAGKFEFGSLNQRKEK